MTIDGNFLLGVAAIVTALGTWITALKTLNQSRKIKTEVNSRMKQLIDRDQLKQLEIDDLKKEVALLTKMQEAKTWKE